MERQPVLEGLITPFDTFFWKLVGTKSPMRNKHKCLYIAMKRKF